MTTDYTLSDAAPMKYIPTSTSSSLRLPVHPPAPLVHRRHRLPLSRVQPLPSSPLSTSSTLSSDLAVAETKISVNEDPAPWLPKPSLPTLLQPSLSTSSSKASRPSRHVSFAAVASTLLATSGSSQREIVGSSVEEGFVGFGEGLDDPSKPHSGSQIRILQRVKPENMHNIDCSIHSSPSSSTIASRRRSGTIKATQIQHSPGLHHSSSAEDSSEHWMTLNTYETTPRFSRLGLTSPHVVLPVRARKFQRDAGKRSSSTVVSRSTSVKPSIPTSIGVASYRPTSSNETSSISSRHSSESIASTSEMGTAIGEIGDGTNVIKLTFPPPIKEGIHFKSWRPNLNFSFVPSCMKVRANGDHNYWVNSKLDLQADIPAGFGRQLEIMRGNKRRGMVNRLLQRL